MTTDRKHPSAGFWITVTVVAVLVGYPLSYGPWWAILPKLPVDIRRLELWIYRPLAVFEFHGPDCLVDPYIRYLRWWRDDPIFQGIQTRRSLGSSE